MPVYYLDSGNIRSIRLYACPTKESDKAYLCTDSNIKDAQGNWKLEDGSCSFRNASDGSNRFQIVRDKDGWLATAHDDYVVFHAPEDKRDSWFVLEQEVNNFYAYLKLGNKWVCIGNRFDDGIKYVNLKSQGDWALVKRGSGKGVAHNGWQLSAEV